MHLQLQQRGSADMHRMSFVFSERMCNQDEQPLVDPMHVQNCNLVHAQHARYWSQTTHSNTWCCMDSWSIYRQSSPHYAYMFQKSKAFHAHLNIIFFVTWSITASWPIKAYLVVSLEPEEPVSTFVAGRALCCVLFVHFDCWNTCSYHSRITGRWG